MRKTSALCALAMPLVLALPARATPNPPKAPLPYVIYEYDAPGHPGWPGTSVHDLHMTGRRVGYALLAQLCNDSGCQRDNSVQLFDGVSDNTVDRSPYTLIDVDLSASNFVWQVPNNGDPYQTILRAIRPGGVATTLAPKTIAAMFATDGTDTVWQVLGPQYRYDIIFNGVKITASRQSPGNNYPTVAGGNVMFDGGDGRFVAYDGHSGLLRDLPKWGDSQTWSGRSLSPDGRTALWLVRNFDPSATDNAINLYDFATKKVRTINTGIVAPGFDVGFDGDFVVWYASINAGLYMIAATDVRDGSTDYLDDALTPPGGWYSTWQVSKGLLSFSDSNYSIGLYDLATGDVTYVATDTPFEVASSGKNVAWFTYGSGDDPPRVHIAMPADEAVSAMLDVVLGWNLQSTVRARLMSVLSDALSKLQNRAIAQAVTRLQSFEAQVAGLRGQGGLSVARALQLIAADDRVIDALTDR